MLRPSGQLEVVRGSIAMCVYVGHRGDFDFEDFEGRRSNETGSGRVYVLVDDATWRLRNTSGGRSKRKSSRAQVAALCVVGVCLPPWEFWSRGQYKSRSSSSQVAHTAGPLPVVHVTGNLILAHGWQTRS